MSLIHIVEPLITDGELTSPYRRAIRLFEFQIAVFRPSSFERLVASESDVTAPSKELKTARIFAAIKILEKIEADLKLKKGVSVISIRELSADEDYRSIFDDVIAPNGGWPRIRHSTSVGNFDNKTKENREEAVAAANIVDYSYRFSKHLANAPYFRRINPGGVNAAKYVVRNAYMPFVGESTMKNLWRKYQLPAIFIYLMLNQNFNLKPSRVGSKNFSKSSCGRQTTLKRFEGSFAHTRLCAPSYRI